MVHLQHKVAFHVDSGRAVKYTRSLILPINSRSVEILQSQPLTSGWGNHTVRDTHARVANSAASCGGGSPAMVKKKEGN